jgi:mono/diheme cytochrome c family protein
MRAKTIAGLALAFLALGKTGAVAQDDGDPDAGRDFARGVCATCHEVERLDAPSPHPDAPAFRVIANVPGMTATALYVVLNNPHRQMPDLILSREELHNVAAYILTLKE